MLNVWRKPSAEHSTKDRLAAITTAVVFAVVFVGAGMLIAVAFVDGDNLNWNWTVIANVGGGLGVGIAALIGAIGGLITVNQRTAADQRAEWWKRAEKASDYLVVGDAELEDDPYVLGMGMLRALELDDVRTGQREKEYILALSTAATLDTANDEGDNEEEDMGGRDDQDA